MSGLCAGVLARAACCLALAAACAAPASAEDTGRSVEDLAQQKLNPFADAINLPATLSLGFGFGPRRDVQPSLTFQPLIPLPLSENWRLVTRSTVPIIDLPGPDGVTGLGDIDVSLFLSPARTGTWVWGAGPILQFPTATDEALGTGKWAAGPTAALVYVDGPWLNGMLVSHLWSFAGSSAREDVSLTQIEVKLSYQFSSGWYIDTNPTMTYDWKAPSNQGWTIPVGLDVGKVFKIGNQGMSLQLGAYDNAKKPAGTANWFLQTQFTLIY
ncbi:MAG: hypothetical protein DMD91_27310 [Candidatus Rokuibacteriota bacterium]|nr:MAG: hypothetical protein DMD91_27310 [Candidatus Rokubacteria bacterium]